MSLVLESSKSESNRALIINALTPGSPMPENLAAARDTQTMMRLLKEEGEAKEVWDVLDAGTTMRFLTAFAAVSGRKKIMTGSEMALIATGVVSPWGYSVLFGFRSMLRYIARLFDYSLLPPWFVSV